MNGIELREAVRRNLASAGLDVAELRVQPDPFSGWRVLVVSAGFRDLDQDRRRQLALQGLEDVPLQSIELLTPEEVEWAKPLLVDLAVEQIPMWPEALARAKQSKVVFASDLEQDLDPPIVTTFYSMRGGVGRSTALAYAGRILARRGHTVLCVDMDLEAPGLAALFGKETDVAPGTGVVAILHSLDLGEEVDVAKHIVRLSDSHEFYCLPAGVPDADYSRRLRLLDPEAWYREERNPLHLLFDRITQLPFRPDVVLIDARTGITPFSAALLFDISDLAVITFFPHPQARVGTGSLVRAILKSNSRRQLEDVRLTPEPRFLVSPLPPSKDAEERYRRKAAEWIAEWLSPLLDERTDPTTRIEVDEISHFVPYREFIATSEGLLDAEDVSGMYAPVADWLERFIPTQAERRLPRLDTALKADALKELEFLSGDAESQESGAFRESFVTTEVFEKAMSTDKPLVIGRKGTGKTALLRWFAEEYGRRAFVVIAPAPYRRERQWMLGPDGFKLVDAHLRELSVGWREFWTAYTAVACFVSARLAYGEDVPGPDNPILESLMHPFYTREASERVVACCLKTLLGGTEGPLLAWEWLRRIDSWLPEDVFLLYDGLDTGFGNAPDERQRRTHSLEGLLPFVLDRESALRRMHFKVLLREDLWRKLSFENKSHLFGRSVRLEWRNQVDYLKTVLKQALRSKAFKRLVTVALRAEDIEGIDSWPDQQVFVAWNVLAGERMKGGKTAFTRNWVWNRLADSNRDHSPRYLLRLFREATEFERVEQRKSRYEPAVIRPRALSNSLGSVSAEAVDAMRDEFHELSGLLDRLKSVGRTPFDADEVRGLDDEVDLGREVGLLGVYESDDKGVRRYTIADLYRLGLGMARRGPA